MTSFQALTWNLLQDHMNHMNHMGLEIATANDAAQSNPPELFRSNPCYQLLSTWIILDYPGLSWIILDYPGF